MKNTKIAAKAESATQSLVDIQSASGNWDYDPYMHGMLNGMLLIQNVAFDDGPYKPYDAPDTYLCENKISDLHKDHPALKEAFEHYRILLNITIEDSEDREKCLKDLHRYVGIRSHK